MGSEDDKMRREIREERKKRENGKLFYAKVMLTSLAAFFPFFACHFSLGPQNTKDQIKCSSCILHVQKLQQKRVQKQILIMSPPSSTCAFVQLPSDRHRKPVMI